MISRQNPEPQFFTAYTDKVFHTFPKVDIWNQKSPLCKQILLVPGTCDIATEHPEASLEGPWEYWEKEEKKEKEKEEKEEENETTDPPTRCPRSGPRGSRLTLRSQPSQPMKTDACDHSNVHANGARRDFKKRATPTL